MPFASSDTSLSVVRQDTGTDTKDAGTITAWLRPIANKSGFSGRAGNAYYFEITISAGGSVESAKIFIGSIISGKLLTGLLLKGKLL